MQVSIRAPAWGATQRPRQHDDRGEVSIRAPAWGATTVGHPRCGVVASFNSRSRVGSDRIIPAEYARSIGFNSRSRVGSDPRSTAQPGVVAGFNSRSRVGSDAFSPFKPMESAWFQFALPRGERLKFHNAEPLDKGVSIRAPAWGATSA